MTAIARIRYMTSEMGHFHPLCSMSWNASSCLNSFPAGRMPAAEGVGHVRTRGCQRRARSAAALTYRRIEPSQSFRDL